MCVGVRGEKEVHHEWNILVPRQFIETTLENKKKGIAGSLNLHNVHATIYVTFQIQNNEGWNGQTGRVPSTATVFPHWIATFMHGEAREGYGVESQKRVCAMSPILAFLSLPDITAEGEEKEEEKEEEKGRVL